MVDFAELSIYVVALAAILLVPELYDIHLSHNEKRKLIDDFKPIVEKYAAATPDPKKPAESPAISDIKELFEKLASPLEGLEGLGRVVMTLGVIAILGIVVIQLTLSTTSLISYIVLAPTTPPMLNQTFTFADKARSDQIDLLKTVVTALAGGLTTMIGFYFGTKAAEQKSQTTSQPGQGAGNDNQNKPHK